MFTTGVQPGCSAGVSTGVQRGLFYAATAGRTFLQLVPLLSARPQRPRWNRSAITSRAFNPRAAAISSHAAVGAPGSNRPTPYPVVRSAHPARWRKQPDPIRSRARCPARTPAAASYSRMSAASVSVCASPSRNRRFVPTRVRRINLPRNRPEGTPNLHRVTSRIQGTGTPARLHHNGVPR